MTSDAATNHAMAIHLKHLLGIAQAEHVVAGIKLQAGQQVGHPALAALHADERMWDAVVKALTPQQQQQGGPAAPVQKSPAKPVATLEDIRATLALHGQEALSARLEDASAASLMDVLKTIETTPWQSGTQAAVMANLATLLQGMLRSAAPAPPKRDWMDSGGSSDRLEFGGSSRLP